MAGRSDDSLAALLLAQRLVDTDAPALKASEYWGLLERVPDPGTLLGRTTDDLTRELGLSAELSERIVRQLSGATAFAFQLDEFEQSGLRVVASVDDEYPGVLVERLGRGAPPMLYMVGASRLLENPLLGVVGSRDAHPDAAAAAQTAAQLAAERGMGVVSGGAKGVDRLAVNAALEAGGTAVGVLADSLVRTVRDPDTRRAIAEERLCLITPYKPTAGFSVANAMGRNKLTYALSQSTFVVSSDLEKGGTWAGAVEALRGGIVPVLVWTGPAAGPGNEALVERGGLAVESPSDVFTVEHGRRGNTPSIQLTMDV